MMTVAAGLLLQASSFLMGSENSLMSSGLNVSCVVACSVRGLCDPGNPFCSSICSSMHIDEARSLILQVSYSGETPYILLQ